MKRDDPFDKANQIAKKRAELCETAAPCPKCWSDQVQLVEWVNDVRWRCRKCGHKF